MTTAPAFEPLSPAMLAQAGRDNAETRARGCARPVRLTGSKMVVDATTGEVTETRYSSADELDGVTYVPCRNRRASECESCSREYKGDAWHLFMCGLAGGKGITEDVRNRPCTFATLTAPSFGAVHGIRQKGPCRARRDKPVCPHGRPLWCRKHHREDDPQLGQPLCWECYDYTAHVLWQWHAPELWRRFTIALQRQLAKRAGLKVTPFRKHAKISYSKIVEFQARAAVHVHAPIRLDGPDGADGPACSLPLTTRELEEAIHAAAAAVYVDSERLLDGTVVRLRWGKQTDTRSIVGTADRDSDRQAAVVHPEQVAAYLAKYLTKTTDEFGLPTRVKNALQARAAGASPHAVRIIAEAERLSRHSPEYARMRDRLATLGYRGHPITKSRHYSVTFGQIRRSRRAYRRDPGLDPDADIREVLDDDEDLPEGFELVSSFEYAGRGYLSMAEAAAAVRSAAMARMPS